ncbi:hypothetical protein PoB_005810100 [Plakobranchus ocellatus]|uniref:Uncharacterized protein n=1 Tax=Plakobranchus ocellatus TaxID=259542 RepID=A0AAV4CFN4_9GAST|nr:hypothetical protein PoB_005810100 [Plakobranchus ocellatus]
MRSSSCIGLRHSASTPMPNGWKLYHRSSAISHNLLDILDFTRSLARSLNLSNKSSQRRTPGRFLPKETESQNICALISGDIHQIRFYPKTLHRVWEKSCAPNALVHDWIYTALLMSIQKYRTLLLQFL